MNEQKLKKFIKYIKESKNIVFFTGAGVSVPSGIPDFRSSDGIYNQKFKGINPIEIISNKCFKENTELFYDFYFKNLIYKNAKPNLAHTFFANLKNKNVVIVTQNIDNLHIEGKSKIVYELHGNVNRNYCIKCNTNHSLNEILKFEPNIPKCKNCNSLVRPDVTLFGEMLDENVIINSIDAISKADMLIVAGTSLEVQPAASFINYYKKDKFVLINKSKTNYDSFANLVFNDSIIDVLKEVEKRHNN